MYIDSSINKSNKILKNKKNFKQLYNINSSEIQMRLMQLIVKLNNWLSIYAIKL